MWIKNGIAGVNECWKKSTKIIDTRKKMHDFVGCLLPALDKRSRLQEELLRKLSVIETSLKRSVNDIISNKLVKVSITKPEKEEVIETIKEYNDLIFKLRESIEKL